MDGPGWSGRADLDRSSAYGPNYSLVRIVRIDYINGLTGWFSGRMVLFVGKPTAKTGSWQELRKCNSLTPAQADALFFPGPGGKVNKAKKFCDTCPVISKCLQDALKYKLEGFWAGTTESDRALMKDFIGSLPVTVLDFLPRSVQDREKGITVGRRPPQPKPVEKPYDYLDALSGPTDEELRTA